MGRLDREEHMSAGCAHLVAVLQGRAMDDEQCGSWWWRRRMSIWVAVVYDVEESRSEEVVWWVL